ncbi:MAG TPA: hypothetical protein VH042_12695 [Solirubrobacterales bacterium]|jgi:hypothetical protein|nr:hypothetical protein [Solirubrobacterales bacterium]
MKQHLLSDGDRAALQALVPLAGALGVGTIFALFFGGRRKSGIAVFELFAIVAVLTAAGSTAYFSVSLLHQNEAITSHELTQTATPLVVAAFLLVFVSVFARLPGSLTRIVTLLPLAIAGIVIAALLASSTWSAGPENASLVALAMLAVGALVGVAAWLVDRLDIGWEGRSERRRLTQLYAAGYAPAEKAPRFALPESDSGSAGGGLACWSRKDRSYLDQPGWLRLREEAGSGWRALATGEARPPIGPTILVQVKVGLRDRSAVRVSLLEPSRDSEPRVREIRANEDGLFDVTDLGIV